MELGLDIWTLVGFLGAAQAMVVGLALLTTSGAARKVFGLLLVNLGSAMGVILYSHLYAGPEPMIAGLVEVTSSLLAPVLLYSFVALVVGTGSRSSLLPHLIVPAVWIALATGWLLFGRLASAWLPPIELIVGYQVVYTVLSARLAWGRRSDDAANSDALALARTSVLFMVVIHLAQGVRMLVDTGPLRDIVPITSALVMIGLTFVAVRRMRVFSSARGADPGAGAQPGSGPPKYSSSSLTEEQAQRGLERFLRAMEGERAYLRPDLTLDRLAEELGLARTHLSQLVNERCGKPFLDLVADFRVEEAQRLLADPETRHLTVEAVGDRAGFQSKSAFYSAFKKRAGVTPAEHRRRLESE